MNNTLIKGLSLLQLLAHSSRAQGVTELAQQMGVAKSHAHHLLQTLVEQGYAHREDPGNYRISMRVWELGQTVLGHQELLRAAAEPMQVLQQISHETVHLTVLDGNDVIYVHQLVGPQHHNGLSPAGSRAPAACLASGKAMMAWLPADRLEAIAGNLQRHTAATITDPGQFLEEMAAIRRNGYAANRGEWHESTWGLAAPVRDGAGKVVAAIGISGPPDRFASSNWSVLSGPVIATAGQIGARLELAPRPS